MGVAIVYVFLRVVDICLAVFLAYSSWFVVDFWAVMFKVCFFGGFLIFPEQKRTAGLRMIHQNPPAQKQVETLATCSKEPQYRYQTFDSQSRNQ